METLKRLPFKARKSVFEKLEKIVDIASLSKEERMKYDESIKVYRDNLAVMAYAENKGRTEGRAEGLKETARNLKHMKMSAEVIQQATGLSAEEIEKL
jgi:predicted transposase/invertase (TIGR01784 family)